MAIHSVASRQAAAWGTKRWPDYVELAKRLSPRVQDCGNRVEAGQCDRGEITPPESPTQGSRE